MSCLKQHVYAEVKLGRLKHSRFLGKIQFEVNDIEEYRRHKVP